MKSGRLRLKSRNRIDRENRSRTTENDYDNNFSSSKRTGHETPLEFMTARPHSEPRIGNQPSTIRANESQQQSVQDRPQTFDVEVTLGLLLSN